MSQHQRAQGSIQLNPNLVALILIANFVLIGGLVFFRTPPQKDVGESIEVAVAEPTATPLPSSTPMPPTPSLTPPATETPAVSASITEQVTTIDTGTPPMVADAAQANDANNAAANYDPALAAEGEQLFMVCSACHGPDARGLPNLGKNLVESEFVHSLSDEELLTFVKTGRPMWDSLNTTGIDMPPKGGNPAFTDEDILAIIAYIRSLSASSG